jgi:hypothetical protein
MENTRFCMKFAVLAASLVLSPRAKCAAVLTVLESGGDVVVLGSGTLDLNGLALLGSDANSISGTLNGGSAALVIGEGGYAIYGGSAGPSSFGQSGLFMANDSTGDLFGIGAQGMAIIVPFAYSSGFPMSATSTWKDSSISSLGLTPGTYTYTWATGIGATVESLTVNVIPEPSTFCLIGAFLIGSVFRRARTTSGESGPGE